MSGAKHLIIAAGGTGGHMFPAQSLAEEMLNRGWRVTLNTDPRGARYTGGFPQEVQVNVTQAATFAGRNLLAKFNVPFKIFSGVLTARKFMKNNRPDVVAGFGGYPALPAMAAAGLLKVPRILHEQNGVLGRVNQLFAKRVDAVACGTWPTELPDGVEGINIGNPVRRTILDKAGTDYIAPGDWPMSILVIGGSQGSSIVAQTAARAMNHLPEKYSKHIRVACQVREADNDEVAEIFEKAGVSVELEPFFTDVPQRISEAQLIVTRSGASTVADISVIGRPSILIPLAIAIRDEQTANARGLVNADAAILIPESELTAESLADCMKKVLSNPKAAIKMAQGALSEGKPEAAKDLANLVENIAGSKK